MSDYFIALLMDAVVSVSVSVSAETESFFRFRYRFQPKRKKAVSASFGFGQNEKKPFGRALISYISKSVPVLNQNVRIFVGVLIKTD